MSIQLLNRCKQISFIALLLRYYKLIKQKIASNTYATKIYMYSKYFKVVWDGTPSYCDVIPFEIKIKSSFIFLKLLPNRVAIEQWVRTYVITTNL